MRRLEINSLQQGSRLPHRSLLSPLLCLTPLGTRPDPRSPHLLEPRRHLAATPSEPAPWEGGGGLEPPVNSSRVGAGVGSELPPRNNTGSGGRGTDQPPGTNRHPPGCGAQRPRRGPRQQQQAVAGSRAMGMWSRGLWEASTRFRFPPSSTASEALGISCVATWAFRCS